jgi:hypothetical protein
MKIQKISTQIMLAVLATSVQAATITWDGQLDVSPFTPSVDNNWTTATNWVGDSVPADQDYVDIAKFTDTYVGTQSANLSSGRKIQGVIFDNSTGWSITGSQLILKSIDSSGIGTNTINTVKTSTGSYSWNIATGNTLFINSLTQDNTGRSLTLSGGGTLELGSDINRPYTRAVNDLIINDVTVRINDTYTNQNSNSRVFINDLNATLILQNSATQLNTWIGDGRFVDNTGDGIVATDIGGGFAQVTVIPEPSSIALLMISGLTALCVLRKRKR